MNTVGSVGIITKKSEFHVFLDTFLAGQLLSSQRRQNSISRTPNDIHWALPMLLYATFAR